jgi:hypothetical protein
MPDRSVTKAARFIQEINKFKTYTRVYAVICVSASFQFVGNFHAIFWVNVQIPTEFSPSAAPIASEEIAN